MEESIRNLISPQVIPHPKLPLYVSKHPKNLAPTASTFGTGIFNILNAGGNHLNNIKKTVPLGQSSNQNKRQTIKNSGSSISIAADNILSTKIYTHRKSPVPKLQKIPLTNVRSSKNFILTNKIETILMTPKKLEPQFNWTEKENYGKTPSYIGKIKALLQQQKDFITTNTTAHEQDKYLREDEIEELQSGLKAKWNIINEQYQKITHKIVDGLSFKAKKTKLQQQLQQIQNDIRKLNKKYIMISS